MNHAPIRNKDVESKPWEGEGKKPWHYRVTAAIPHLDTPETLPVIIDTLRMQTERPFIQIIDTGSTPENLEQVESLRSEDVEVHVLRLNGVRHPSDFPAMAMDLAQSACRTEYLFCTHADCFLRERTVVEGMVELCREHKAVGYEISPRLHDDWRGMLGHTCTMFHIPTLDRLGAGWSMRRLATMYGLENHEPDPMRPNWPDTELLINYQLREAGITPFLIGSEKNHQRNQTRHFDHCRSLVSGRLYSPEYAAKSQKWLDKAMRDAKQRLESWREE